MADEKKVYVDGKEVEPCKKKNLNNELGWNISVAVKINDPSKKKEEEE